MPGIVMPTFVLLPDLQQIFLATAERTLPDDSEKSKEFAFLVERMPAIQVPLGATILIPERGPELGELVNFTHLGPCALMLCVLQQLPGDRSTIATCSTCTATYGAPCAGGNLAQVPDTRLFSSSTRISAGCYQGNWWGPSDRRQTAGRVDDWGRTVR